MSHHPDHAAAHTREAIAQRLAQGGQPSGLKDAVYGAIDGAVTTFAIVSSVAGASLSHHLVLILGLANIFADGFSMAAGNFLGTRAENQARRRARREEEEEIEAHPEWEREEVRQIYAAKGFSGTLLEEVVRTITSNREHWVDTMLHAEHGVSGPPASGLRAAMITFLAFCLAGAVPLAPYLLELLSPLPVPLSPFALATLLTALTFFLIGALKSRFVDQNWLVGGLETTLIGATAAALAYLIGYLLRPLTTLF